MRTEDGSIIHRCLNGKPGAFGILVDKYKAGVYAYVYTELRDLQDAQDVTQEVFIQAYRDLRSLRKWESFAFWLHRIAYRRCMDFLRIRSRRVDREFIEDQDPKVVDAPSLDSHRRNQLSESVWEALDALPEIYREVLILHYFGGMTIKDIASAIGASPSAIGKRLSRARARLKEEMIAMMDTAFEGHKLQASFTFRIVEAVKRIKINPMPRTAGLPWGLSLAAGIIVTVLVLNPHLSFLNPMSVPTGSPLSAETKVLKTGEIPVDILDISPIQIISSNQRDGDMGGPELPDPQNTLLMAPQAEGGKWTEKSEMPMATMGACSAVVGGRIYVIGGSKNNRESFTAVEEYDPATDTWKTKADMPDGRGMGSASAVNGKIYVIGGWRSLIAGNPVRTVEEYDPATDTWKRKTDMPTARGVLSTSVVNGKIYAIGGLSFALGGFEVSAVEEYDPATDTWEKKADMLTARQGVSTSVVDGKIYAISDDIVEEYDPKTDSWTKKAPMPTPRANLSTCEVDGRIYAIGGQNGMGEVFSTVEVYDPATDTWMTEASMPTARAFLSACAVNGRLYSIGGTTDSFLEPKGDWPVLDTVEEYDTEVALPTQGTSVEATGKTFAPWGSIKSD